MDALWQDVRYAARLLFRQPGFAAAAIATLAFGIGANTAIFSAATALLVRPLPIRDVDHVVFGLAMREGVDPYNSSALEYTAFRDGVPSFASMGAATIGDVGLVGRDEPEQLIAASINAGYLRTLQVQPIAGRSFSAEDDRPGAPDIAIIGYDLWQRRFGGDMTAIGRTMTTDAGPWTIVGVMPRGFDVPLRAEVWTPMRVNPETLPLDRRVTHTWDIVARLRPDTTRERAAAETSTIAKQLEVTYPQYRRGWAYTLVPLRRELLTDIDGRSERFLIVLMVAVGLLLLICCANIANLLLVRGVARGREVAVRLALGAGRGRLLRFFITESVLLGVVGGAAGVLLATWLTPLLQMLNPIHVGALGTFLTDFHIDTRMLMFALIVSVATGVVFGCVPAMSIVRDTDLATSLRRREPRSGGDLAARRWLSAFVVAEIALSTALFVASGLTVQSFTRLLRVDLGFEPAHVLALRLALSPNTFPDPAARQQFMDRTLDRVRVLPGVRAAGMTTNLPLDDESADAIFAAEGRPRTNPADVPITAHRLVSPGYLQALGTKLVKGRFIDDRDRADTQPVVVVTEEFARQAFPGEDALGRRVRRINGAADTPWLTIVGVVADVKEDQFNFRINRPAWYLPYSQGDSAAALRLLVRTDGDLSTMSRAIREAIRSVEPAQTFGAIVPLQAQVTQVHVTDRFTASLAGALAATGLFLAIGGLYGVIAYSVGQRAGEFGLRIALGARQIDLVRLVMRQGAVLTIVGLTVGLTGARALTTMLSATLYEVAPGEPAIYAATAAVLATVALIACYVPARRATTVDPLTAIRGE